MTTNIKLRRSAVEGKIPTTSQLDFGEIAVNTFDGNIFIKKDNGSESIVTIREVTEDNLIIDSSSLSISSNAVLSGVLSDIDSSLNSKVPDSLSITAGAGLTGGGTLSTNRTISHANTSTQASLTALTGGTVVSDIDLDTYGHITNLTTRTLSSSDVVEGTNLYYTNTRARNALSVSGDLSYNSSTGVFSFSETYSTASEIKTAYESNSNTNAFSDSEQSKLTNIESGADVTDTVNVTAAGALMDSELTNIAAIKGLNQDVSTTNAPTFQGINSNTNLRVGTSTKRLSAGNLIELSGPTSSFLTSVQDGSGRVQMRWNAGTGVAPTYLVSNEPAARYEILDVTQTADALWRIDHAPSGTAGDTISWSNILSLGTSTFTYNGNNVWHAGNDGAGSGLDADLLDGQEGAFYRNASNLNAGTVPTARLGSGTANSTTYLAGDNTWKEISTTSIIKTTNYTAKSGDSILTDASGGTFTITLPATPSSGDNVILYDGDDWSTTNITVARNGSTIEGLSENLVLDIEAASVTLIYSGTTWELFVSAAPKYEVTNDTSTNATKYLVWNDTSTGSFDPNASSTKLYFNPSTGILNSTDFNSLSDRRLKTNIKTIQPDYNNINKINGVSFNWKDNGKEADGFIAQEVEKIFPHMVNTDEETGNKSVSYAQMVPHLLEIIKDINNRLLELESKS